MATYRYLLCDLLTDRPVAWLPLRGVDYDVRISSVSPFSGRIDVVDQQTARVAKVLRAYAARGVIYTYRNGQLWSNGHIPWVVSASGPGDDDGIPVKVTGSSIESWLYRRVIRSNIEISLPPSRAIGFAWWSAMNSGRPEADIGIIWDELTDYVDGPDVDINIHGSEGKSYGAMVDLAVERAAGDTEWMIRVDEDPVTGLRTRNLTIRSKINWVDQPVALFSNATVKDWDEETDMANFATSVQGRGDAPDPALAEGAETFPTMSSVFEEWWPPGGYAQIDGLVELDGLLNPTMINNATRAQAPLMADPRPDYKFSVEVESTGWKPSMVGSPVRVRLSDLWHTPPLDTVIRPYGVDVKTGERGREESHTLLLREET